MIDDQPVPKVGDWYLDGEDRLFTVVAINDDDSVEIQLQDGSVEEMDMDTWHELGVESADEPDDWSQAFDDLEADDIETSEAGARRGYRDPTEGLDL
jgi:hypothetical protein